MGLKISIVSLSVSLLFAWHVNVLYINMLFTKKKALNIGKDIITKEGHLIRDVIMFIYNKNTI